MKNVKKNVISVELLGGGKIKANLSLDIAVGGVSLKGNTEATYTLKDYFTLMNKLKIAKGDCDVLSFLAALDVDKETIAAIKEAVCEF